MGIDQLGIYQLQVLNIENGCSNMIIVLVEIDILLLEVAIVLFVMLICVDMIIVFFGSVIVNSIVLIYEWSIVNGNLLSGVIILELFIDMLGIYIFQVINVINECV